MRIYRQPRKITKRAETYATGQIVGSITINEQDRKRAVKGQYHISVFDSVTGKLMNDYFVYTYRNDNLYGQEQFVPTTKGTQGVILPNESIRVKISKKGYQKGQVRIKYGRYTYSVSFYLDPIKKCYENIQTT